MRGINKIEGGRFSKIQDTFFWIDPKKSFMNALIVLILAGIALFVIIYVIKNFTLNALPPGDF